jgi:predicted AAA+ superfamily ATPase
VIKRYNYDNIAYSLARDEISILVGARQVGKTTILKKILDDLSRKGELVLYFNMDIESDAQYLNSQQLFLNRVQLEFGNKAGFICIDEIQQKKDAGRFLKGLFDMDLPYKFIVTGSGSLELKEKVGEALTGRKHLLHMETVSFTEFVDFKTKYKYTNRLDSYYTLENEKTNLLLNEYLIYGGYPKVLMSDQIADKKVVMNEIFTSYISKDISYLLGVRSSDKFIKMINLLAAQCGGIINYSQLAQDTGVNVSTLKTFLWYAEQTYIISLVKPYFTNPKKEITKSPVVYFNDSGMLNFASGRYALLENHPGFVFQNFIYNLLRIKYESLMNPVQHWRTKDKAEVDFVIHIDGKIIPVEVKYSNLQNTSITRSFRSFLNKYNPEKAMVINLGLDKEIKIDDTLIEFVPFWKLL